jgi:hypothetical protein
MTEENRIWILLARRVTGEITERELDEFKALVRAWPDLSYSVDIVIRFMDADNGGKRSSPGLIGGG